MSESSVERETLVCPICLDLLQTPVTLPCGHSFCRKCVQDSFRGRYMCPVCRKSFHSRPALLVEQVRRTSSPPADCYAGPQDVSCDMCTGPRKIKAHKSCLQCLVSYCEMHLQPHTHIIVLQKHQLVAPVRTLQENICHKHNEVKKMFCRTDNQLMCVVCSMDQHKHHVTVPASTEKVEKEQSLQQRKDQLNHDIKQVEEQLQGLQQEEQHIRHSADRAVQRVDKVQRRWSAASKRSREF
ncbi:hypothetical protein WMY93_032187 [Mugilogobius chulae]|uniref:Uncharacterized protein n=1 Tax=Mugilogobius chulae TaxID=88201 RepID=A0AAW0MEJ9_9GOBI